MTHMPANRYDRTGLELKVARVRARVRQHEVAAAMGVSPSRVTMIEREAIVTEQTWDRYMAALEVCHNGTSEVA